MDGVIEPEVVTETLEERYGLAIKAKSPTRGLVERLIDGTLRPQEQQQLLKTREIRRRQLKGETTAAIAKALGELPQNLRSYMAGQHFRVMMRWLTESEAKPASVVLADRRKEERAEWNALAPKALAFFQHAFDRHPPGTKGKGGLDIGGTYLDADRAERAAKLIADGQGWTEPEPAPQKRSELKLGVIQAQMSAIAAVDRGETVVRVQVEVRQDTREGDHRGEL